MPFLLRSGNSLVFISRDYTRLRSAATDCGSSSVTSHCPLGERHGRAGRSGRLRSGARSAIASKAGTYASRVIGDWVHFYGRRHPHKALGMKTSAGAFVLAA